MGIQILTLGAGQQVGRSCIYVKFSNGVKVLLDCGIHNVPTQEKFPDFVKILKFNSSSQGVVVEEQKKEEEEEITSSQCTIPPKLQMLGITSLPKKKKMSIYTKQQRQRNLMSQGKKQTKKPVHSQYIPVPGYLSLNQHIDAVLVSHFHVDHCGALPYLTQHFQYRGPIIMTQPTRSIVPLMLRDFAKIQQQQQQQEQNSTSQTLLNHSTGGKEQSTF